jgi:hypothetical protein
LTQLILDTGGNNISLPESKNGGYLPYKEELGQMVQMISGRIVKELRGRVWRIAYQYGYFDNATMQKIIESCEKGRDTPITCSFLPQNGNAMLTKSFFVEDYTRPKFMWSRDDNGQTVPLWADFSVELREVKPSD